MTRAIAIILAASVATPAAAGKDHAAALHAMLADGLRAAIQTPGMVAAVEAQNAANAGLTEAQILELDNAWRDEAAAGGGPIMAEMLGRPMSKALMAMQEGYAGVITEVQVTDALGLNVAQANPTSDLWQGDEAKFLETFPYGPEATQVSDVEFDESSQMIQVEISFTLVDAAGAPIGTSTVGVNVEMLP